MTLTRHYSISGSSRGRVPPYFCRQSPPSKYAALSSIWSGGKPADVSGQIPGCLALPKVCHLCSPKRHSGAAHVLERRQGTEAGARTCGASCGSRRGNPTGGYSSLVRLWGQELQSCAGFTLGRCRFRAYRALPGSPGLKLSFSSKCFCVNIRQVYTGASIRF